MSHDEVQINVNRRFECLEEAQRQSASRAEEMLGRLCDKIDSGHELLRVEMQRQECCLRSDFGDHRQRAQDISSVRPDGATSTPHVYASTPVSSGHDRSIPRRAMSMNMSDSLPNGQVTTTAANKSVVVIPRKHGRLCTVAKRRKISMSF